MTSRDKAIAAAGSLLQVHWSEPQLQGLERGLEQRLKSKARRRRGAGLAFVAVVATACALFYLRPARPAAQLGAQASPATIVLGDGSRAEVSAGTQWREHRSPGGTSSAVELEVTLGRLRLSVVHHAAGEFRIDLGDVKVEVIGTVLVVERRLDQVTVTVEQGRVKVMRGDEPATFLDGGEKRIFVMSAPVLPQSEPMVGGAAQAASQPDQHPSNPMAQSIEGTAAKSWQALAREGEYAAAYGQLNPEQVTDEPGDLLLAADVARLSGHPARAIPLLRRVADKHPRDPRAALAAFTAGRVYLEDLGNPRDAALAFQRTRALQPGGPMVEPALAREVEAWARAGETQRAKDLAREYLIRYPQGSKRKVVARLADEP